MADTIFFSWQSDLPEKTNWKFIEDALNEVIVSLGQSEDELYEPIRDLELDQDTKGVPGAPPVVETIFRKISECSVFVPDLTFVGSAGSGRRIPNPNVLIEYGWALATCGHSRIVAIANLAFGKLTADTVPFDLRHHRWPITYHLTPDTGAADRDAVRKKLVAELTDEIRKVLSAIKTVPAEPAYEQLQPKSRVSSFLDEGDVLCRLMPWGGEEKSSDIIWHDGPQLFLRVIPQVPISEKTPLQLREMIKEGRILPFGHVYSTWIEGNEFGAVIFEAKDQARQKTANRIVQVSDRGEIWAIDGFSLRESKAVPFIEVPYANALASYLRFSREQLGVKSRVKVIAGMTGVSGMQMWRPRLPKGHVYVGLEEKWGNAVRDTILRGNQRCHVRARK
ncbi:MAG: hypothetical protein IH856_23800 [Deltaproteobacteria bacterium]|nr:hypothetical protein [Deltaproteobacteria bacterium]